MTERELHAAIRSIGETIATAIREAWGPQARERMATPDELLRGLGEVYGDLVVVDTGSKLESLPEQKVRFASEIHERLFFLCGYDLDADLRDRSVAPENKLAVERVNTIMEFIGLAAGHSLPRKLLPRKEG